VEVSADTCILCSGSKHEHANGNGHRNGSRNLASANCPFVPTTEVGIALIRYLPLAVKIAAAKELNIELGQIRAVNLSCVREGEVEVTIRLPIRKKSSDSPQKIYDWAFTRLPVEMSEELRAFIARETFRGILRRP
jgi:hypothetical protein